MKKKITIRTLLDIVGLLVLFFGLMSAVFLYEKGGDAPTEVIGYEEAGGSSYPVLPEDSKKYQRSLELYGGKANVLADEMRRGFIGLWHGKTLGVTVACITVFVSVCVFLTAWLL